ncbi:MAG TPA: MaoC family dehydratase N-terminal domain-containing protein [Candidatus Binatus sp.]|nr:MaoC family dehydratase N-terminal domain-containing protein [Candidatus Binatus sp.]
MSDAIVTPELLQWIGRKTPLRQLEIISAADVRRYIDATGDTNPLWLDNDFARAAGYRGRLLPPTLVGWVPFSFKEGTERTNNDPSDLRRQLPLPSAYTNVRNAGSETEWLEPAYLGDQLSTQNAIVDITARQGKAGLGIYISQVEEMLNSQQQIVLRRRHTLAVFPDKQFAGAAKDAQ